MCTTIRIDGADVTLPSDQCSSLLDLLSAHMHLGDIKKGCDQWPCGACTVVVNGDIRILSCVALAVQYEGCEISLIGGFERSPRTLRYKQSKDGLSQPSTTTGLRDLASHTR